MVVPIAIAVVSLTFVGWLLVGRSRRRAQFIGVLREHGFREVDEPTRNAIDFSVTVQWPEARGMRYQLCFAKDRPNVAITVANVSCFVTAGANVGKCAAARADEVQHTVIALRFAERELPRFSICPKRMEGHFRYWTEGGQELQVGFPEFDDAFFVLGKEREVVAPFVTSHFPSVFPQYPDIVAEAGGHTLLLYQQACILTADSLVKHLVLADELIENITNT
jgi:hypothetical protein